MKLLNTVSIAVLLAFTLSCSKPEKHNGFVKLFDGESLDGWEVKCIEQDMEREYWTVDEGTILCNSLDSDGNHNYIWLQTKEEYDDFELRLKFQVSRENKGNSGVQIRSRYYPDDEVEEGMLGWLDGPQVDIEPASPWRTGLIYDETRDVKHWINPVLPSWEISETDYPLEEVIFYFEDEAPGWNEMTIICKGTSIKTIVNGILVSDYDGSGVLDDEAHRKYNVGMKGHIALQLHKNSLNFIRFKDIEIKVFE